ncbi:hypothetical protein VQH23_13815 [Pararoseomonas sp. SCSIO 73927]|uniref:hypothetical protein n=1 Tax=Pararoseomonas sp. SCSIO 73927 TaxID=3114537 RepID=UPI0030D25BAE
MPMGEDGLEVFQDLLLHGPTERQSVLLQALVARATAPWRHVPDAGQRIAVPTSDEVVAFEREAGDGLKAAGLVLWQRLEGYEVTNIVPRDGRELGRDGYNAILMDFVRRIAEPAASESGFSLEISAPTRRLEDWLSADAAHALRRFSGSANKSTGSSHPLDRRRWLAFLLQVHHDARRMDGSELSRWLVQVEGWQEDQASELASEYDFGLELLAARDRQAP